MAQGRKGTGDEKTAIGLRTPPEIYRWLDSVRLPRETDTGVVLRMLEVVRDFEEAAGARAPEVRAMAVIEQTTYGKALAELAVEALDARRRGKR